MLIGVGGHRKKNTVSVSVLAGVAFWVCERLNAQEPEVKQLCGEIVRSQKAEMVQMRALIQKLD